MQILLAEPVLREAEMSNTQFREESHLMIVKMLDGGITNQGGRMTIIK